MLFFSAVYFLFAFLQFLMLFVHPIFVVFLLLSCASDQLTEKQIHKPVRVKQTQSWVHKLSMVQNTFR